MDTTLSSSDFPPLVTASGGASPPPNRNWLAACTADGPSESELHLSHFPDEPEIVPFTGSKLISGAANWKLCLVGYSIGRRPYYEALLGAIKKTWALKGSVKMISLNDGFFLFHFSCSEDLDMVWTRGVWFLLGKPFVIQKWHPKFKPKREEFKSVPIWIKIHDLPLACWNSEGISRIASKVGIPLAADSLTSQMTRLTYARVCVLVDNQASYPEEIRVSLDGDVVTLKVQYEWKPTPCEHCKSLVHYTNFCPSRPKTDELVNNDSNGNTNIARGRSHSRIPKPRKHSKSIGRSNLLDKDTSLLLPSDNLQNQDVTNSATVKNAIGLPLHYQPHSPPPQPSVIEVKDIPDNAAQPDSLASSGKGIISVPNLNSPTAEDSSSSVSAINHNPEIPSSPVGVIFPNKFDILDTLDSKSDMPGTSGSFETAIGNIKYSKNQNSEQKVCSNAPPKKSARGKQTKKPSSSSGH
ncbi:hypothetical protein KFK09_008480 [Dendrobium nobile]|uniref:DUF4283 domain-containing protein n=1 Tax=Dendrobium nobile TaxID=94219 RepID=A0A8T3BNX6_DENNO|nr:hypothetical protein KFK09_008480 [Dendrobium nobile]